MLVGTILFTPSESSGSGWAKSKASWVPLACQCSENSTGHWKVLSSAGHGYFELLESLVWLKLNHSDEHWQAIGTQASRLTLSPAEKTSPAVGRPTLLQNVLGTWNVLQEGSGKGNFREQI
jgi:hypothetical protein